MLNCHIQNKRGFKELTGHVTMDISNFLYYFLSASNENYVKVKIIGKRKRGMGPAVPEKHSDF